MQLPTPDQCLPKTRVDNLRLRFANSKHADLALSHGVHAIGRDHGGDLCRVDEAEAATLQFCVDRRGVWLRVRDGTSGLHVNGRPVKRMAMLRGGDAVYIDGMELLVLGEQPSPAPTGAAAEAVAHTGIVLRGMGGACHGRCFSLDGGRGPLTVGRLPDSDIRVDDAAIDSLARLEPHDDGIVLRGLAAGNAQVNGWPVREALLRPCDQLVLESQHRFLVEAPICAATSGGEPEFQVEESGHEAPLPTSRSRSAMTTSVRRLPWLLLAALLLATALGALLVYGVR